VSALLHLVQPLLVAVDLGGESLVTRPLGVDGPGGAVGVLLDEDGALLDPVLELLTVLEEGVEHVLVAEALQVGAVVDPPLSQLLGLKANMLLPKTIKAASQKIEKIFFEVHNRIIRNRIE
jgi:hypothetical protein